jgi:hypothetical protein
VQKPSLSTLGDMTDTHSVERAESPAPRALFLGGALLLASVVATVVFQPGFYAFTWVGYIPTVLFSAALMIFAFGIRGSGSITAGRPLGTGALAALAVWLVLMDVLPATIGSALTVTSPLAVLIALNYLKLVVQLALAIIAVVQIARAGVVPAPLAWVPTWVLVACTATWLLSQLAGIVLVNVSQVAAIFLTLDGATRIGGTIVLGVLAIVLADRMTRTPLAVEPELTPDVGLTSR